MKNIIFDLGGVILKDKPISVLNDINIDNKDKILLILSYLFFLI